MKSPILLTFFLLSFLGDIVSHDHQIACGISSVDTESSPGFLAHKFPWLVRIIGEYRFHYRNQVTKRIFRCEGVILDKKHILTNYECEMGRNGLLPNVQQLYTIFIGGHLPMEEGFPVFLQNPSVKLSYPYAIITLQRELQWTDKVRPICLPEKPEIADDLTQLTIASLGSDRLSAHSFPPTEVAIPRDSENVLQLGGSQPWQLLRDGAEVTNKVTRVTENIPIAFRDHKGSAIMYRSNRRWFLAALVVQESLKPKSFQGKEGKFQYVLESFPITDYYRKFILDNSEATFYPVGDY